MTQVRIKRGVSLLLAMLFLCLGCFGVFATDGSSTENGQGTSQTTTGNDQGTQSGNGDNQGTQTGNGNDQGTQTGNGDNQGTPSGNGDNQGTQTEDPCKNGHDFGEWIVLRNATCTQGGSRKHICKRCNKEETEEIKALGHDYKLDEASKVAPTCEEKGLEKKVCSRCQDEVITHPDALGHTDANKDNKCDRCGKEIKPATPTDSCANGHDYEKKVIDPTCTEKGRTELTCKRCGDKKEENIMPALGHKMKTDPAVDPTCEKEGKTEKTYCERCGLVTVESKAVPKVDHHGIVKNAVAATCQKEGSTGDLVCEYCGKVLEKATVIPAGQHDYEVTVITPATCTAGGLNKEECKICKDVKLTKTEALGHDFVDTWIVEATCTSDGKRVRTCQRCGLQTKLEPVPALGHDKESVWTVDKAPTCTKAGTKSHHCTRCDKAFDVTTIPKNGHDYKITVKPATTKKDGSKTYDCKVCGKNVTKVIYKIASIKLSKTSYICDNTAKKPSVTVKNTADKKLTKDTDYKLTYAKGRKQVGTYTVKVTFIGDYKGSKTLKFTIKLGKVTGVTLKKASYNKVKVTCDKIKGAQKYCIYYSTSKNGEYAKLTNSKKTSYTTGALKTGKTYYFKVRAVAPDANGKNQFGAYSAISKIKL